MNKKRDFIERESIKNKGIFLSLRDKMLFVNIMSIALPILLLSLYFINQNTENNNNRINQNKLNNIQQLTDSIDNYWSSIETVALSTYADNAMRNIQNGNPNDNSVFEYMHNTMLEHDELLGVFLIGENGLCRKLVRGDLEKQIRNFKASEIWKAAENAKGKGQKFAFNVMEEYLDFNKDVSSFVLGLNNTENDSIMGCLIFLIEDEHFTDMIAPYKSTAHNNFIITDNSGRVFYSKSGFSKNKVIIDYEFSFNVLSKDGGFAKLNAKNGEQALISATTKLHKMKVVELFPYEVFTQPVDLSKNVYQATFVLMGYVLVLITVIFANLLTSPISRLNEQVQHFGENDFEFEKRVFIKDEIGSLENSFIDMSKRIKHLVKDIYFSQLKEKEAKLNALQSQINPHFLYNTLETMASIAEKHNVSELSKAARDLGSIMRYSIGDIGEESTVRQELRQLRSYCAVQKLRFGNRINVLFDVDAQLLDKPILKMLLQPLIENAIIHGVERNMNLGVIILIGIIEGDDIVFSVKDNGVGMDEQTLNILKESLETKVNLFDQRENNMRGFALMNVRWRLWIHYGEESGITVNSSIGQGTTVELRFKSKEV